jgi:hypothetical protein
MRKSSRANVVASSSAIDSAQTFSISICAHASKQEFNQIASVRRRFVAEQILALKVNSAKRLEKQSAPLS